MIEHIRSTHDIFDFETVTKNFTMHGTKDIREPQPSTESLETDYDSEDVEGISTGVAKSTICDADKQSIAASSKKGPTTPVNKSTEFIKVSNDWKRRQAVKAIQQQQQEQQQHQNETDDFFKAMALTVKKWPQIEIARIKLNISQMVLQEDLRLEEEDLKLETFNRLMNERL